MLIDTEVIQVFHPRMPSSAQSWRRSTRAALAGIAASAALLAGCGTTVPLTQQVAQGSSGLGSSSGAASPTASAPAGETSAVDGTSASTGGTSSVAGSGATTTTGSPSASGQGGASNAAVSGHDAIASTGPGWDQQHIYIGIITVTDAPTVGHLLGVESLDYGDQNGFTKDMIDYVNSHGGLFGRSLVTVAYDVSSTTDPNTSGQAACTRFTQDHRVVAALGSVATDSFYQCMKNAHVPVINGGYGQWFTATEMARYKGWAYYWGNFSFERLVPVWLERLGALGYFKGWDTAAGAPGIAPVKVGLLHTGDAYHPRAFALLKAQLKQHGYDVVSEFQASNPNDYSNAVLQFRAAKVTHLFLDSSAALFYPPQAEQQHYYARYAVTSDDYIQPFLQDTAPAAQLRGMMGVGWVPAQDVDLTHKPAPDPGQARCFKIMKDRGADVSKNNYQYTANTVCDTVFLFLELARAGHGLAPANLVQSLVAAGSNFPWASQMGTGVVPTDLTLAPEVRGLQYVESCSCVQYAGPVVRVP